MGRRLLVLFSAATLLSTSLVGPTVVDATATTLPAGVTEAPLATGVSQPTAMAQTPDGRFLVAQQTGALRVVDATGLRAAPMLSVPVNSAGERGLLGVAVDPEFATTPFVYVYYTTTSGTLRNRISRFTVDGNTAVPGSEQVLLELDPLSSATNHNGGALHFGVDGRLYIGVGDNARGANAPSLATAHGKMLRINRDGTIPSDNPFATTATGINRAIWATGLRNPFTFAVHPSDGRIFVNDVGQNTWEEINVLSAGADYGWPATEGATSNPAFTAPLYAYLNEGGNCAIAGAAFYDPPTPQFPADHLGDYLFGDYCGGWIRRLDPLTGEVRPFASDIGFGLVDLLVEPTGSVVYLTRTGGRLMRVTNAAAPSIATHPVDQTVEEGQTATFSVVAGDPSGVTYQWQRDGIDLPGQTAATLTVVNPAQIDDGAVFRVTVTSGQVSATSLPATLRVTTNQAPEAIITAPVATDLYEGGQAIAYAGTAVDPEEGVLGANAMTWRVALHHGAHTHPFVADTTGAAGSFAVPTAGHVEADVWFRIHLTVRDSKGRTDATYVDVHPRTVELRMLTEPAGRQIRLDDQVLTTPLTVRSVVGVRRAIGVVSPQGADPTRLTFVSWSDGGAPSRTITTPASDLTLIARFAAAEPAVVQEVGGQVVLEAEAADTRISRAAKTWRTVTTPAGFAGLGAVLADPNSGSLINAGYAISAPELRYRVRFATAGTYQVWLRIHAASVLDNSAHVGLDGQPVTTADRIERTTYGSYVWTRTTMDGPNATLTVAAPGTRTVNLWMREDGLVVDRVLLSRDAAFVPSGIGPAASARVTPGVDVDPPMVVDRSPAAGESAVGVAAPIGAGFSEPLAPARVSATTVRLTRVSDGGEVPVGRALDASGTRLTITPYEGSLEPSTAYRVDLSDGLTDPTGNELTPVSWTFTTSAEASPLAWQEAAGSVAIEAHEFDVRTARGGKDWTVVTSPVGFTGAGAVLAGPNTGALVNSGYATTSPELGYRVRFATPGTYQVWLRMRASSVLDNTAHIGLAGQPLATADRIETTTYGSYVWTRRTMDGPNATLAIATAGTRMVNLWMREDGLVVDRILLSRDAAFVPTGSGPAASLRR